MLSVATCCSLLRLNAAPYATEQHTHAFLPCCWCWEYVRQRRVVRLELQHKLHLGAISKHGLQSEPPEQLGTKRSATAVLPWPRVISTAFRSRVAEARDERSVRWSQQREGQYRTKWPWQHWPSSGPSSPMQGQPPNKRSIVSTAALGAADKDHGRQ
jgi:hypothetical protein